MGSAIVQPVILAGGSGSRLWPASRTMYSKQLLPLTGDRTMLQQTVLRLTGAANLADSVIVVCNENHRFLVAQQLRDISAAARILLEPEGRNTAPAIALAALDALEGGTQAAPVLLVMPADHVIGDEDTFRKAVALAASEAESGALVTFGIVPRGPHTGYGYIEAQPDGAGVATLESFVEKPDLETAESLLRDGRHFWNSGMFVFRADTYLEQLGEHAPDMLDACRAAMQASTSDRDFVRPGRDEFLNCPADSVDYAVMEKTDNAKMVPLDAGWSDVGSWSALHEISSQDSDGNTAIGDVVHRRCTNSYLSGESRLVAAVGVDNLVVVETKDAVLVADSRKAEGVKALVEQLSAADREEVALHRQVFRPWGSYDSLENRDGFQVKRLIVNPGAVLSLQMHHRRAEHWVVVRGTATVTLNDDEFELNVNESTHVPVGAKHRIANYGTEPAHIIEVQCGDYLGEDDIVRFEDEYGREGTKT
ncbi:MAG: mannose-1-phosphate guanylyltransferase/mannose-6-phosphate isomerase [Woeseiaceae bacterium]